MADLAERLDGDWHTLLSEHTDGRGIRVGVLSRLPLQVLADTAGFPVELAAARTGATTHEVVRAPTRKAVRGHLRTRYPDAFWPDKGDAWRLVKLAPRVPADQRYSASTAVAENSSIRSWSAAPCCRNVVDVRSLMDPRLPSVSDDPPGRRDTEGSDHASVLARVRL